VSVRAAAALAVLCSCGHLAFDPDGLVARYAMDDDPSGGRAIASSSAYDGTCSQCPTAGPGRFGGAYVFAGAQWVDLPALSTALVGSTPYTVTVWVLPGSSANEMTLVAKALSVQTELNAYKLMLGQGSYDPRFETATDPTGGYDIFDPSSADLRGAWHFLATSWDGATKRLYLDGMVVGTEQPAAVVDSQLPVLLGADLDGGVQDDFLVGALDDLRFYDRVLSDVEIAQLAE